MINKICRKCKQTKLLNDYHVNRALKDGLCTICKSCTAEANKQYFLKNKNKCNEARKKRFKENRSYQRKYEFNKCRNDINYRLKKNLRRRLQDIIKGYVKVGSHVKDLGCSVEEFKIYLQAKFTEGMSWDNYGKWHIDHIKPLSAFDLTDRQQFLKAVHYTNLQPLWADDNIRKSNKWTA